ncbi:MAG TPA: hypothetical protein VM100_13090 [Longimicrobiales bacterium]|nr:hypothetical protein [Longimicrobiales bacterium]
MPNNDDELDNELEDDLDDDLYDDDEDDDLELDDDVDFDVGATNDFRSRGKRVLNSVGQIGRQRIGEAANQHKLTVADRIDDLGSRVGGRFSGGADYLRTNDITVIADDLVDTVRRHPILSAGVALGAGYVAGKVIGIGGGGGGRKSSTSKKIRRAVVSSLAAMAATKLKDSLKSQVLGALSGYDGFDDGDTDDDDYDDEPIRPRGRRPRKQGAGSRPRPRSNRQRDEL